MSTQDVTHGGRHWQPDVVHDGTGVISGLLPVLEDTQPFEAPTVEFDRAAFEYAIELDRKIAAARLREQQRSTEPSPLTLRRVSRWARARRYVRENWTLVRAVFVAGSVSALVGGAIGWWAR